MCQQQSKCLFVIDNTNKYEEIKLHQLWSGGGDLISYIVKVCSLWLMLSIYFLNVLKILHGRLVGHQCCNNRNGPIFDM